MAEFIFTAGDDWYAVSADGEQSPSFPTREAAAAYLGVPSIEADCRAFAEAFPLPNVLRAIDLAEAGRLTWSAVNDLFKRAAVAGIAAVSA